MSTGTGRPRDDRRESTGTSGVNPGILIDMVLYGGMTAPQVVEAVNQDYAQLRLAWARMMGKVKGGDADSEDDRLKGQG